jgi:pimeloyl-ACP methyl ester carboxylesterase
MSSTVATTVFPGEKYQAPRSWAERAQPQLIYFHEVNRGGHFPAREQPQHFEEELRAAFRPLRKQRTSS